MSHSNKVSASYIFVMITDFQVMNLSKINCIYRGYQWSELEIGGLKKMYNRLPFQIFFLITSLIIGVVEAVLNLLFFVLVIAVANWWILVGATIIFFIMTAIFG